MRRDRFVGFLNKPRRAALLVVMLSVATASLWPQDAVAVPGQDQMDDPRSFVGMKIEELVSRYGPPELVRSVRGSEDWQDDVVFVYNEGGPAPPGDYYIFRDRVWQVGLRSAYGITVGDHKAIAALVLGGQADDRGDYVLVPLPSGGWPLMLRINIDRTGFVSAIFVYRSDY